MFSLYPSCDLSQHLVDDALQPELIKIRQRRELASDLECEDRLALFRAVAEKDEVAVQFPGQVEPLPCKVAGKKIVEL